MVWNLGFAIYSWKGLEHTFPMVYYTPKFSKKLVAKLARKICNHLVTARQGRQKNGNGKTNAVLFA